MKTSRVARKLYPSGNGAESPYKKRIVLLRYHGTVLAEPEAPWRVIRRAAAVGLRLLLGILLLGIAGCTHRPGPSEI